MPELKRSSRISKCATLFRSEKEMQSRFGGTIPTESLSVALK